MEVTNTMKIPWEYYGNTMGTAFLDENTMGIGWNRDMRIKSANRPTVEWYDVVGKRSMMCISCVGYTSTRVCCLIGRRQEYSEKTEEQQ